VSDVGDDLDAGADVPDAADSFSFGDDEADDAYCEGDVSLDDMTPQALADLGLLGLKFDGIAAIEDDDERMFYAKTIVAELDA